MHNTPVKTKNNNSSEQSDENKPFMATPNNRKIFWYDLKMKFLTNDKIGIKEALGVDTEITAHEMEDKKRRQSLINERRRDYLDTFMKPEPEIDNEVHFDNWQEILVFDEMLFETLQNKIRRFFGKYNEQDDAKYPDSSCSLDKFRLQLKNNNFINSKHITSPNSMTS